MDEFHTPFVLSLPGGTPPNLASMVTPVAIPVLIYSGSRNVGQSDGLVSDVTDADAKPTGIRNV
jgi:hypothetical protein